jgi:hypothetical protein
MAMFNIWTSIQKSNANPEKGSRDFKPIKCLKLRNKNYSLSMLNTTYLNHKKTRNKKSKA